MSAATLPADPTTAAAAPRDSARPVKHATVGIRTLVSAALIVLFVVALFFLLQSILSLVLIILLAIVFAEGIRPLVAGLRRRGVPQAVGILTVYIALLAVLAGLVALLVGPIVAQASSLASKLPVFQRHFLDAFNGVAANLHLSVDISQQIAALTNGLQHALVGVGSTIVAIAVNFVLILVIAFMWLLSSTSLKRSVIDLLPTRYQAEASAVIAQIGFRMGGYLRAAAINALVVGVATGFAAFLLGLPSPVLLAAFTGVIAMIPVVGAVLGAVVPALLALTISPLHAVLVLAVMAALQLIDANTVVPLVTNRVVALPSLAVVIALSAGGALAGVIGALLAVPIAAAIQVVLVRVVVPWVHHAEGRPA